MIYAGTSYAIAMLEVLVHANLGRPPSAARYVEASLPDDIAVERLDPAALPDWDGEDLSIPQAHGARWLAAARSAVLLVPSVVTKLDLNAVINPAHPDAARLTAAAEAPVLWDERLFHRSI